MSAVLFIKTRIAKGIMLPSLELSLLMSEFARSGVRELHIRSSEFELYLSKDSSTPTINQRTTSSRSEAAPSTAKLCPVATTVDLDIADLPTEAVIIRAPNLGTFYRAPKPGAENYVEIGSKVSSGDELCLIEVMKLFTSVQSEIAGTVYAVLAVDGEMVEADQPLFAIVNS